MQIVYWAHSYRKEDAPLNRHFGHLIEQAAKMIVNFDPPSQSVNESKLSQNLRSCDGMVAVLTWRADGPSPYILHEIGLCLRSRKPLIVFLDDRLRGDFLPARILQRRFSHRTYFRQVREHLDALRVLKAYMGDPPPSRYQPSAGQRMCGLAGIGALDRAGRAAVHRLIDERLYHVVDLEKVNPADLQSFETLEHLANLDVSLQFVDSTARRSIYWMGALSAASIPSITFTMDKDYEYSKKYPSEFQPRLADSAKAPPLDEILKSEFDLFEQDFLKVESSEAIERYVIMQTQAGALMGHYEAGTREQFARNIMRDQFNIFAPTNLNINYGQVWNQVEQKGDISRLADELRQLREAMGREVTEAAHKISVAAVEAAEESARKKDGPKAVEYLKTAGNWALQIAEKIGTDLAKEAIKGALGL